MENGELEKIRLECLALFLRIPNDCFSLADMTQLIIGEPTLIKNALKRLSSWGIIEEVQVEITIFYRYRSPEYATNSCEGFRN